MCYIIVHDKQQHLYDYDKSGGGGRPIPKNATTESLEAIGATLNFIGCWLELFHRNCEGRWKMYNEDMKKLFKQITTMK